MIKRIIGLLFAAAVVAVIVFTVLHRGEYRSVLFSGAAAVEARSDMDTVPAADTVAIVRGGSPGQE